MRLAYVDPVSGASGDMLLGALVDAGLAVERLRAELTGLRLDGWRLECERVLRAGLAAAQVTVHVDTPSPPRTLAQVLDVVRSAALPEGDRERAASVFELLGAAEAEVHGRPDAQSAHLHEVGAADALVDVVGSVVGLRLLGVDALGCGPWPLGAGSVRAAHGRLPVPAPAVLAIAARVRAPLAAPRPDEPAVELFTPTAAAILGALARFERPSMRLDRVGVGAGRRDLAGWPNVLRLWLGAPVEAGAELGVRPLLVIETNVDDMLPEHLPFLEARLREAGARDVWWSSVQMKKGRPGVQVTAVAEPPHEQAVVHALLAHSSTLGVRVAGTTRYEAPRELLSFESSLGAATVKVGRVPGAPPRVAPEHDVCAAHAEKHGLPIVEVYRIVTAEALVQLGRG